MNPNKIREIFDNYIYSVTAKYQYEETSEMGYRADFEILLKGVFESIDVSRFDHDAKAKQGNKPDFVVVKNGVPILYVETKDIGVSLDRIEKSEQMSRYFGYTNLILTDYLEFRFYKNGLSYGEFIKIGNFNKVNRTIIPQQENYEYLAKTFLDFTQSQKEPIKSGKHLAKIMGGKAQRIRDNVRHLFETGSESNADLVKLYESIKELLIHDLTPHTFADMYAQTLVYGLFVARFHDKTLSSFSRVEARELIPNTNKFLKRFFDHIVGAEFKNSLKHLVDELCEVFSHADVSKLMEDYYKTRLGGQKTNDPVIHFYEDFLNEYDAQLRKKMGAYYTPQPVVDFIVKSVDKILKNDFELTNGLADTSKLENGVHKVQILDPATGTGTFLGVIIREIYVALHKEGQKGRWPAYVHNDLLPRLHGFELMMAPYTIAHLRLGIAFRKTGFWDFHRRLGIYLTNTLEEGISQQLSMAFGLAESIAEESKEAADIKTKTPVMVVIGNPPYSGVSSNETKYANSLVDRYKVEPGGTQKLQERKHWLNDDYVKFISYSERMIEKTGYGIVAMITNNGYIDNPTFRGMRWQLSKTFDKIFVLDLHGNAKKKETAPDGSKDENVFDIMQGVGIILAVKTGKKKNDELAKIYHADVYGTRKHKFNQLSKKQKWEPVKLDRKMLYFVPKDNKGREEYEKGIRLDELFLEKVTGIVTMGDDFIIDQDKQVVADRVQKLAFGGYTETSLNQEFNLGKNYAKFILDNYQKLDFDESKLVQINYRPFDKRWTYFDNKVLWRWREKIMRSMINDNIAIGFCRQVISDDFSHVLVAKHVMDDSFVSNKSRERGYCAPLFIYDDNGDYRLNFNDRILKIFTQKINDAYEPKDIFDYIYAVLYSPSYRKKYIEFLKIDFPRVPSPKDKSSFKKLVGLGKELRQLHLFESLKVSSFITTYPEAGSNEVEKLNYKNKQVNINEKQYFGNVPETAWNFYIGGYQPAQKWLKDRKGEVLTNEEIEHYQRIIVALVETDRVMREIDKVIKL